MSRFSRIGVCALLAGGLLIFPGLVFATELQIIYTNDQPAGGFAVSPLWAGIQDGTYQTFSPGSTASLAVENVAELANTSTITSAFTGNGPQTTIGGAPIGPGSSATATINVTDPSSTRYLDFLSMVVPSNDFFIGNSNPAALPLFDGSGNFTGTQTIQIYGSGAYDAGTEVDNINYGAAFIVGDNITDHIAANGTIQPIFGGSTDFSSYLSSIDGKATPYGYSISHVISSGDLIATIQVTAVPEPSSFVLLGVGVLLAVGVAAIRARRSATACLK